MVAKPEPMVTGDAVVLDVQIAQLPVRALAALIDLTVVFIAYILGFTLWAVADLDDALSAAVLIVFTVLSIVGYPVIFEVATRGRSLGKMALGLRVVSDDGGPERFRQALCRALSGFIEIWMFAGAPAVVCSMLSTKGKRIGDVFAGTMVVSERGPAMPPPVPMPPALAWWASSLQLSGLRPEQAELARQFLARASQLEPAMRDQMAHRIYAEVVAQISPPPPASAPRRWCWPRCWPSATAGSSTGCVRRPPPRGRPLPRTRGATSDRLLEAAGRIHQPRLVGHPCPTMGHVC